MIEKRKEGGRKGGGKEGERRWRGGEGDVLGSDTSNEKKEIEVIDIFLSAFKE